MLHKYKHNPGSLDDLEADRQLWCSRVCELLIVSTATKVPDAFGTHTFLVSPPASPPFTLLPSLLQLQSMGRLLEEQLPEMMTELLAAVRDKMLCPAESPLTRSLLMEVIELHAHRWSPLEALTTQYYNRTIQKLTTTA